MSFRVSAWSIRNPIPVVSLFIALTLAGIAAYLQLPIKQFPNIDLPIISINVNQRGAVPAEVENQITRLIENSLTGISGIKHVSSTVSLGASSTVVEFQLHSDMQKAMDDVRTAVERTRVQLPQGIDPPIVQRVDVDSMPVITYAVSATGMSETELSWFIDRTVTRALQVRKGVGQVTRLGGADREIGVILDPAKMAALGVTAPDVNAALIAFQSDDPAGRAGIGAVEQNIRVVGSSRDVAAIRDLTIAVGSTYVRLSDIAEVGDGQAETRGFARLDGRPVVAVQISKTKEESDVSVEDRVKETIGQLRIAHPQIQFTEITSTVKNTRRSFSATVHVLIEGIFLAVIVVFLFLRNARATAIAALAMPLSLIPTFAVMSALGFSLNGITMLGLTLVIGILVDDAIVEIENIEKRMEAGQSPYRAALIGADSIGLAVVATTAAIVAVFAPVSMMPGQAGQFFREFGLTVSIAVIFSLAVARLLTPLMAAYLLKPLPAHGQTGQRTLDPRYDRALRWALAHRWTLVMIGALLFGAALLLAARTPVGFRPTQDNGEVYFKLEGPPGATIDQMERAVQHATRLIRSQPQVERVLAQVGTSGTSLGGDDLRSGTVTIVLHQHRDMTTDAFRQKLEPMLRSIPEVRFHSQSGFRASGVAIYLAGDDGAALERAQLQLLREMRTVPAIVDAHATPAAPQPELVITPRPDLAARLNVDSRTLAQVLRVATIGDIDARVAKFSEGERRLPIRLRLPEAALADLDLIANLRVPTRDGRTTPLASVATMELRSGPGRIERYDRERRVAVEANLAGKATIGDALKQVNALPVMRNLPAGVHPALAGDAEAISELFSGFIIAIFAGIGLTFAVLVILFKDFFKPAVIMAALPLCLIGAFAALTISGKPLDLPALIGLLMLMGLCAKNSILLVEFAIEAEREGMSMTDALYKACAERARPIVMTTIAMAAGMLPTALGIGAGSEFRQPMALAVIGGLISSTALSLIFVPVVYEII
ncbi:MAG: Multidrug export protein, partial [Rhizorhabdus sp.]|nr:Multidrug export protein [Rhizorhabdus sp.]